MATIPVRLDLTVDIDPDAWAREYSLQGATVREIRQDVKTYLAGTIRDQLDHIGLLNKRGA